MRMTVNLSDEDVAFIDKRARLQRSSRSAVVQEAVGQLQVAERGEAVRQMTVAELGDAYESAWGEGEDRGLERLLGAAGGLPPDTSQR